MPWCSRQLENFALRINARARSIKGTGSIHDEPRLRSGIASSAKCINDGLLKSLGSRRDLVDGPETCVSAALRLPIQNAAAVRHETCGGSDAVGSTLEAVDH